MAFLRIMHSNTYGKTLNIIDQTIDLNESEWRKEKKFDIITVIGLFFGANSID